MAHAWHACMDKMHWWRMDKGIHFHYKGMCVTEFSSAWLSSFLILLPPLLSSLLFSPLLPQPFPSTPLSSNISLFSSPLLSSPPPSSPLFSGCGVNLGMRGLESLKTFIYKTATAVDQNDVLEALAAKIKHSRQVSETFKQTGLLESMYE